MAVQWPGASEMSCRASLFPSQVTEQASKWSNSVKYSFMHTLALDFESERGFRRQAKHHRSPRIFENDSIINGTQVTW